MNRFSIDVVRDGKRWYTLAIEGTHAEATLGDVLYRFHRADGFEHSVWREREARRFVEVTDQARVLAITYDRELLSPELVIDIVASASPKT